MLDFTTILCTSVREYTKHWQLMLFEVRKNSIVQYVRSCNRGFGGVELSECYFAVRINERLLVDTSNTFEITHVKCIL